MVVTTAFFALRLSNGVFRYLGPAMIAAWTGVLWMMLRRTPAKMKQLIAAALNQKVLVEQGKNADEAEKEAIRNANLKMLKESYKTPKFSN